MTTSRQFELLDRMKRDDLPRAGRAVADVLDDWLVRQFGITSGSHGAGLFLDLLADEGYEITPRSADEQQEPPIVRSHDPVTGVIELDTRLGIIQIKLTPGPAVGFTIAVISTDGPFFVYDPSAPNSWRGPFADLNEVDAARRELGAWPVQRPVEGES